MRFQFSLALLIVSSLFASAYAQEPTKTSKAKGSEDEAAIRAAIDSYVEAFNAANAKLVAEHWADDAVYVNRDTGATAKGRKAIQKVFEGIFAANKGQRLKVKVDSIRLVSPDVAIEDGAAWVTSPDGDEEESSYTAVHVKRKDGWRLDSVRETTISPEAAAPANALGQERLSELEWMLGDWIDESDEATVEYSAHYAKGGNFIVRLFKISFADDAELEGTQVIGWDAAQQCIRSWVFDSEGGFSEGIWGHKGDNWIVVSNGYLSDGQKTSTTATFKQLDDNTLSWKVTNRQVGGEKLPSLPEVKIVRKP